MSLIPDSNCPLQWTWPAQSRQADCVKPDWQDWVERGHQSCADAECERRVLRHPPLHRIAVLHWPRRFHPQVLLRLQDPIRLAQKFPADERQIGVTARNDLVSVVDIGNQSYCTGSDLHLVPNTPCARDLKSLRDWNARLWRRAARRNVDEAHPQ